ncbi:response regulator transcription factor [Aggregatilinea lenta]|uniref:response regulator transcription factor n=1 Tax=Aggregatilinea lenta TaxID=913108 RepID=UPI0013C36FB4|nr:response regulator [Aggregatilinea lenta]
MFDIVLVEDEPEINDLLGIVLKHDQIRLHYAVTGADGLATIDRVRPQLVLLDLMLPGHLDGWDVYRTIRDDPAYNTMPVIILTVVPPHAERMKRVSSQECDLYMLKPFDTVTLRRQISRLLGQSSLWKPTGPSLAPGLDPDS